MSARALAVLALAALVAGLPWIAYAIGLANLDGRPTSPAAGRLSVEQAESLHISLRKAGVLDVPQLSPWQYAIDFVKGPELLESGGVAAARLVARHYAGSHVKTRRASALSLSATALTIWLTRNWTSDEILAAAYEIVERR